MSARKATKPAMSFREQWAMQYVRPMHHFELNLGKSRTIPVMTDFPLTPANSKDYSAELTAFIAHVESDTARRRARPRTLGGFWKGL